VTWEVAQQLDFGIEGRLLKNRLSFEVDRFTERRNNILSFRNASVPQTAGLSLPRENIGIVDNRGWDGSVTWRQQLASDASFEVTFNGGYAQNKILFWDEAPERPRAALDRLPHEHRPVLQGDRHLQGPGGGRCSSGLPCRGHAPPGRHHLRGRGRQRHHRRPRSHPRQSERRSHLHRRPHARRPGEEL